MNLSDQFLIAMPGLLDPSFNKSVTYLCQHDERGSLGVTINQPLPMTIADLFGEIGIELLDQSIAKRKVLSGGPVSLNQGFILHSTEAKDDKQWEHSLVVNKNVTLSSSKDVLVAIAEGRGPKHFLIALGYSGWGEGQIEKEIMENSWLTYPADHHTMFELELEKRWQAAAKLIGFDINLMSSDIGHA